MAGQTVTISDKLASLRYSPAEITAKTAEIYRSMLARAPHIRESNFNAVSPADVRLLCELYDARFFSGMIGKRIAEAQTTLQYRLESRMTRTGASTRKIALRNRCRGTIEEVRYEIVVSTHLLFNNFTGGGRTVEINGYRCRDRLEALQRLIEHELVHLVELLWTGRSSCSAASFKDTARRLFGHTDVVHALVTTRETALVTHGIRMGSWVKFSFQGRELVGKVNAITKRVTVLVEDREGPRYTDGKRYAKYYVPLSRVQPAGTTA